MPRGIADSCLKKEKRESSSTVRENGDKGRGHGWEMMWLRESVAHIGRRAASGEVRGLVWFLLLA
jgi:hypothetical protein